MLRHSPPWNLAMFAVNAPAPIWPSANRVRQQALLIGTTPCASCIAAPGCSGLSLAQHPMHDCILCGDRQQLLCKGRETRTCSHTPPAKTQATQPPVEGCRVWGWRIAPSFSSKVYIPKLHTLKPATMHAFHVCHTNACPPGRAPASKHCFDASQQL
jgi:hypothetical protein